MICVLIEKKNDILKIIFEYIVIQGHALCGVQFYNQLIIISFNHFFKASKF